MVSQSKGANPSQQRPEFQAGRLVNDCDPRIPQAQLGVPQPPGAQGNAPHRPVHWAQPEVRGGQPGVNPGYPDQSIPPQAIVPYQNPNQSNASYGRPQREPEKRLELSRSTTKPTLLRLNRTRPTHPPPTLVT